MKQLRKISIVVVLFLIFFYLFNIMPVIPVEYEGGESKNCSLNYLTCLNSQYEDNYPSVLKNIFFILFIMPLILPTAGASLVFKYVFRKYF